MAKKNKKPAPKTPRPPKDPNAPKPIRLDKAQNSVLKGVRGGQDIANVLGLDAPLSRVSTDIPEDQQRLIASIRELSDPTSAAFVGRRSGEESAAVDRLRGLMDSAGVRSSEASSLIDRLRSDSETRGQRTQEMADNLANLKDRAARAGQRSEEMKSILGMMQSGLAGLNSQENQALREQAQREVDRKLTSALDSVRSAARTGGLKGGASRAAERNARRDAMMAQADMEQKNLLSNVELQDKRRMDYAGTLGDAETNEFNQGRLSNLDYSNSLTGAESTENQRYADAINAYAGTLTNMEDNEFGQKQSATRDYAGTVGSLNNNERERTRNALSDLSGAYADRNAQAMRATELNLGQERADKAGKIQSSFGLAGLTEAERARRRALRGNKQRSGNNSGSTATTTPGQFGGFNSAQDQEYYNTVSGILGK